MAASVKKELDRIEEAACEILGVETEYDDGGWVVSDELWGGGAHPSADAILTNYENFRSTPE
jgi:hypothetical protein